ncbi:hypothetical protein HanXRQr2_Chr12g0537111 [Helianthus annuus]|uniref:Uncharacterized protein n=1 Tax=Helianthus annuus TaxID=4232 RepID=A0A251T113_HELAN|nr:hypothetical protein HanXRQr2_Chr12g0537111 [Helianthus annuus]
MGPTEIPSQYAEIIKIPTAHYAFGANFMHPKLMLFGRVLTDGQVNSGIKWDSSDNLSMNVDAQMPSLLEKQCTCKYILQKMDGPNVLQRQAMLDGLHKNGIPPYRQHIALLLMEAIYIANIHDCIHGKLWPVMGVGYHIIHHTTNHYS